jgi:hypothetical protein
MVADKHWSSSCRQNALGREMMNRSVGVVGVLVVTSLSSAGFACQRGQAVSIPAASYKNNLNVCNNNCLGYGEGFVTNNSAIAQPNMVEYDVNLPAAGQYQLSIEYASGESRSAQLLINNNLQTGRILSDITGGFSRTNMQYVAQGTYFFNAGVNKLRIERESYFPHLYEINLACAE